jgi:hypothetical protein
MDIETDQRTPEFLIKLEAYNKQRKLYRYWSESFLLRAYRIHKIVRIKIDDDYH